MMGLVANHLRLIASNTKRRDQLIGYTLIILIWEIYGQLTSDIVLPPLSAIVVKFYEIYTDSAIYEALAVSLQQLTVGFLLAAIFALIVGTTMGRSDTVEYLLDTYVNSLFVTSYAALLPLLIVLFGVRFQFRVSVVFLACVFHMIFTFKAGMENIDEELLNAARVFGASGWKMYRYVLIPAALPFIIAGLRLGVGRSWKGMVIAELWVVVGIGALLSAYQRSLSIPELFVLIITLMILGALSVKILYWVERRVAPWATELDMDV